MKTMVERRKINIWNKDYNTRDNSLDESSNPVNYQLNNIFELRNLCKERNIVQYHLKKEELITALINHDQKIQTNIVEKQDYESMTLMQLKGLAKDRTFEGYNKLNSEALIKLHKEYDEAMLKQNENKETESDVIDKIETKEFKLVGLNGETFDLLIQKDGMVNATMLCKAMGKVFYEYERSKPNQAFFGSFIFRIGNFP
jgi:hypothetical protein